jgi:hypothetical protein
MRKKSLDETVVVSTTKRIIAALPSNIANEKVEQSEDGNKKKVE